MSSCAPSQNRPILKTTKNLALALINATLLLVALCLFLGLMLTSRIDTAKTAISNRVVSALSSIQPLQEDVSSLRGDIVSLKVQIASLSGAAPAQLQELTDQVSASMTKLDNHITQLNARLDDFSADPQAVMDHTIHTAMAEATRSLAAIRGCAPSATTCTGSDPMPLD